MPSSHFHDSSYRSIVSAIATGDGSSVKVHFQNGDCVMVFLSRLLPAKAQPLVREGDALVTDSLFVLVPTTAGDVEVSWSTIRSLTDAAFAKDRAGRAARQARVVGRRLRELRESRGLTQTKVAALAGLQQANLSRIEHGRRDLSISTLWRILAVLGSTPGDLSLFEPPGERPEVADTHSPPNRLRAKGSVRAQASKHRR